jgi:hypothetical protein
MFSRFARSCIERVRLATLSLAFAPLRFVRRMGGMGSAREHWRRKRSFFLFGSQPFARKRPRFCFFCKNNKRGIVKEQINRQQTLQEQVRIIIKDIIINTSRAVT